LDIARDVPVGARGSVQCDLRVMLLKIKTVLSLSHAWDTSEEHYEGVLTVIPRWHSPHTLFHTGFGKTECYTEGKTLSSRMNDSAREEGKNTNILIDHSSFLKRNGTRRGKKCGLSHTHTHTHTHSLSFWLYRWVLYLQEVMNLSMVM